jgi:uncharacterized membrane protein YeaQ/YmgE (transglycosylase-associated protein family)
MSLESIVVWIIVGGIAGLLAEWLIGGVYTGCIGTVIIGVIGAFVGGWLFSVLRISIGATGILNEIITSFAGAAVLLLVIKVVRRV